MTPEREAELFVKIDMLIDICRSLQVERKSPGEPVARVEGRIGEPSEVLQLALAGRHSRKPAA